MASYGEHPYVPHPHLREPLLYVTGLLPHVTDNDLARALEACVPFRPSIPRDTNAPTLSGTIEFKTIDKAEKALATLQSRPIPFTTPPAYLVLTPYPPNTDATLPQPSAAPRLVKQLPPEYTDAMVYDLFRPFGPLASVRMQQGTENAIVEFWREEDAARAQEQMHCEQVGDRNISIQLYQPRRGATEFSPSAPPFVPSGLGYGPPPNLSSPPARHPSLPFVHGPGQQVQYAPPVGPGSNSHSGLIDPCNLFIKNLDQDIDSNSLFSHFRHYGHIVSARVMRDDRGNSRGFGFVSFQTPDQASRAMAAMNNVRIGTKHVAVRLHEPKQLRQEKLAARYASNNGHPRSSSGATSPTLSDDGNFSVYGGWPGGSPGRNAAPSLVEQSRKVSGGHVPTADRQRRSSGSYYHAALSGTLNLPMRYEELAALSTVVRREVISGELTRRLRAASPPIPHADIEAAVDALAGLPIQEVLDIMHDPAVLNARARGEELEIEVPSAPSRGTSADSRGFANNPATASAPEHPSTPASISTPPRTSSPSGSLSAAVTQRLSSPQQTALAPAASERDRMAAAVGTLVSDAAQVELIVDLLLSLSKPERAKVLFSREFLRIKVEEARAVFEMIEDEPQPAPPPPVTPAKKATAPQTQDSPSTPALSSRGPSAVASPEAPATPPPNVAKTLAQLSAKEILVRARSSGLPDPDPAIVRESDVFFESISNRDSPKQKQMVGDKLFKIVKAFDSRNAPKVTISLLDNEDLRSLIHLMNEYPTVLREKVGIFATQIKQSKSAK